MEAIRSKSTQFVERLSRAEFINTRLWSVCICLSISCIVLVIMLVYISTTPKPIYYVPGAWQAGSVMPSINNTATVSNFVNNWLLDWNNFTPATANDAYKRAQKFMSPYFLTKNQLQLKKDLSEIEKNSVSSLFSLKGEPNVKSTNKGFIVQVKGVKILYMGKEMVKEQNLSFDVSIRTIGPTSTNPYGLIIDKIDQEES